MTVSTHVLRFKVQCPVKGPLQVFELVTFNLDYQNSSIGSLDTTGDRCACKWQYQITHSLCRVNIRIKWPPHRLVQTKTHDIC